MTENPEESAGNYELPPGALTVNLSNKESIQALLSKVGPEGLFTLASMLSKVAQDDINGAMEDADMERHGLVKRNVLVRRITTHSYPLLVTGVDEEHCKDLAERLAHDPEFLDHADVDVVYESEIIEEA